VCFLGGGAPPEDPPLDATVVCILFVLSMGGSLPLGAPFGSNVGAMWETFESHLGAILGPSLASVWEPFWDPFRDPFWPRLGLGWAWAGGLGLGWAWANNEPQGGPGSAKVIPGGGPGGPK